MVVLAGCAGEPIAQASCLDLAEVNRFGHADVVPDGLDQRAVNARGGVLGDIRGVAVSPDGSVVVLDRAWQKVVSFGLDGSVERVVFGGEGEGPGEFKLPIDMARTETGVSVLDYELRRVTRFDWSGSLEGVIQVSAPRPFRHLAVGETLWVTPGGGGRSTGPVLYRLSGEGSLLDEGPAANPEDEDFGPGVGMAFAPDGAVLLTTARPGVWLAYDGGAWERRGTPLFPDDTPPVEEQVSERLIQVTPAQYAAVGIGTLGDSLVVQGIQAYPNDYRESRLARDAVRYLLGVFSAAGGHRSTIDLPVGVDPGYLHVDQETGRLFLQATVPFPQVVEYQLQSCGTA
jgi:hypothetical protein